MKLKNIIGGAYEARSPNVSADRCINLFPEISEDGKTYSLYSVPGFSTYVTAANGAISSGVYTASNGRCFTLNGTALYEIIAPVAPSTTATMTSRGTVTQGALVSKFADNGIVMIIVNGTDGWYYTFATDTLSQISDPDFPNGCGSVGFLDGYFIACDPNTQLWYISDLYVTNAVQLVTPTASIRDMTNAAWVKTTMTTAYTSRGITGGANTATRLTATGANSTALQTLTAAASSRTYSCYVKRITGTGTIKLKQGSTEYDITSLIKTSGYTRVELNASILNVAFGIEIVTSGDAIDVDVNQFESGSIAKAPIYVAGEASSWETLDFSSAESQPDVNVGLIVDHRVLWVFGETTIEGFENTGNSSFPLERISGAVIQHGLCAQHSVAKLDNTIAFLGKDESGVGVVYQLVGYTPKRISTHAVEFAIQNYTTISDARAFTYQQEGHHFYCLTFPTEGNTWVYDANTQKWHERASWDELTGTFGAWELTGLAVFGNNKLAGDLTSGKIYSIDMDVHANGSNTRRWLRAWRMPSTEGQDVIIPRLTLDCEVGQGLTSGQGSDPQIYLRISRDGGHTWGPHRAKSLGAKGNYKTRVFWDRNGHGRDVVFEISGSDPVSVAIKGAYLG